MKKPRKKTYFVTLYNASDDTTTPAMFESTKSLSECKKAYNKAREEWYDEETPDCLFWFIQDKLAEQGIEFYELEPECELDF